MDSADKVDSIVSSLSSSEPATMPKRGLNASKIKVKIPMTPRTPPPCHIDSRDT